MATRQREGRSVEGFLMWPLISGVSCEPLASMTAKPVERRLGSTPRIFIISFAVRRLVGALLYRLFGLTAKRQQAGALQNSCCDRRFLHDLIGDVEVGVDVLDV